MDDSSPAFDHPAPDDNGYFKCFIPVERVKTLDFRSPKAEVKGRRHVGPGIDLTDVEDRVRYFDPWMTSSLHMGSPEISGFRFIKADLSGKSRD